MVKVKVVVRLSNTEVKARVERKNIKSKELAENVGDVTQHIPRGTSNS